MTAMVKMWNVTLESASAWSTMSRLAALLQQSAWVGSIEAAFFYCALGVVHSPK